MREEKRARARKIVEAVGRAWLCRSMDEEKQETGAFDESKSLPIAPMRSQIEVMDGLAFCDVCRTGHIGFVCFDIDVEVTAFCDGLRRIRICRGCAIEIALTSGAATEAEDFLGEVRIKALGLANGLRLKRLLEVSDERRD